MWLYDPNQSNADDVAIVVDLADPARPVRASMTSPTGPAAGPVLLPGVVRAEDAARSDRLTGPFRL